MSNAKVRIPRDEVEEMARLVYSELCEIQSGCAYTIVGGLVFYLLRVSAQALMFVAM